mmetsp:Transcript_41238/g.113421  ORF Transcript_41238/g.113421 Transcript_41238/m.113421 type:complete len:324 (+) Transcript_41238:595-1566(+)
MCSRRRPAAKEPALRETSDSAYSVSWLRVSADAERGSSDEPSRLSTATEEAPPATRGWASWVEGRRAPRSADSAEVPRARSHARERAEAPETRSFFERRCSSGASALASVGSTMPACWRARSAIGCDASRLSDASTAASLKQKLELSEPLSLSRASWGGGCPPPDSVWSAVKACSGEAAPSRLKRAAEGSASSSSPLGLAIAMHPATAVQKRFCSSDRCSGSSNGGVLGALCGDVHVLLPWLFMRSHLRCTHDCFRMPAPPNLHLSRQLMHVPQSRRVQAVQVPHADHRLPRFSDSGNFMPTAAPTGRSDTAGGTLRPSGGFC